MSTPRQRIARRAAKGFFLAGIGSYALAVATDTDLFLVVGWCCELLALASYSLS